jgi:cardiolipin synthase
VSSGTLLPAVVSHLVSIVGLVLGLLLIAHAAGQRRGPQSTLAWVLAIVLIPYVGVPLYLLFGGRKLRRDADKKQRLYEPSARDLPPPEAGIAGMLVVSGAPPPRTGNRIELLLSGEDAFRATVDLIERAQRSIELSTLILARDEVGRAVIDRLIAKARSGVRVRVLLDALFRFRAPRGLLASLREAGASIAWFAPVWHMPFRAHANLRLHRKILVVDGEVAIVGGMNLAREYMGPTALEGRWRDLAAIIAGPAVADVADVFHADWRFAAGESLPPAQRPAPTGTSALQVVGSGPDAASDLLYDAFLSTVFEARHRVWIATPYFVPDEALTHALVLAARRRVDVRVLIPQRSNHLSADLAGASYLRQVAEAGARIARFRPGMMHAKVLIADEALAVIGSANFDMRSLFLDYEIGVLLSDRESIDSLSRWYEALLGECGELVPARPGRALVEGVARLIGPLA